MPYPSPERWRSRTTFVFALSIAAVGLGNIWRFAWLMGEHGGGPFLLSYVACLLFIAAPLLVAEVVLGSHGRGSPFLTLAWANRVSEGGAIWRLLGGSLALLAVFAGFMLLVATLVVGGWALSYTFHLQLGEFAGIALPGAARFFGQTLEHPLELVEWQLLAAALVAVISGLGVRRGVGVLAWVAVPLLLTLLAVLASYAVSYGDLTAAGEYLFAWQALDFDSSSFMAALVHAIYTLTLGVAVGLTYGAYAPSKLPIVRSVLAVALFDLVLGVAVGVAIYPLLLASNLLPADGFALLFVGVPFAYGNMPFGDLYGALFFLAVFTATLGSAVALLEPLVAVLEQQFAASRPRVAVILCVLAWLLSALVTADLGLGASGKGYLLELDRISSQWLIPAVALLLTLFVGWRLPQGVLRRGLAREPDILFRLWYFLVRFLAPPVIAFAWLWVVLIS